MNFYVNVSSGVLSLPVPGNSTVKIVGPGESFVGSSQYDRYVTAGLLAKIRNTQCNIRYYVTSDDVDDALASVADTSGAFRYKVNEDASLSSVLLPKAILTFDRDVAVGDNLMVTYYFYTLFDTCGTHSHSVQIYEKYTGSWSMPVWAALPTNFYDLGPKAQVDALLVRTG